MPFSVRIVSCLLATVAVASQSAAQGATAGQPSAWRHDYRAAMSEARRDNKLVMVYFHASWSDYCTEMRRTTFANASVLKTLRLVVPLWIDLDHDDAQLRAKFKPEMFPAFVFVTPEGKKFSEMSGFMEPALFQGELNKFEKAYKLEPELIQAWKVSPKSGEANARLAWLYAIKRDEALALKRLKDAESAGYRGPELPKAYNMVGDVFQLNDKTQVAVDYFKKALAIGKDKTDIGYSLVSLFSCYCALGDKGQARKYGDKLLALPGAPSEYVQFVRQEMVRRGIRDDSSSRS